MGVNVSYIQNVLEDGLVGFTGNNSFLENFKDIKLAELGNSASTSGISVSMSDYTLVVGIPSYPMNTTGTGNVINGGIVLVYIRNQDTWEFSEYLQPTTRTANENFGWSVSVSDDNLIVVGTNGTSKAYIYEAAQSNNSFLLSTVETGTTNFGQAVFAIDNNIFVGNPTASVAGPNGGSAGAYGAVFVYNKDSTNNWDLTQTIHAPYGDIAPNDQLGTSIDSNGNFVAVSSINRSYDLTNDNYEANSGMVYILSIDSSNNLSLFQKIVSPNRSSNAIFGNKLLFVGSNLLVSDTSGVYAFSYNGTSFTYSFTVVNWGYGWLVTDFDMDEYFVLTRIGDTSSDGVYVYSIDFTNKKTTFMCTINENTNGFSIDTTTKLSTINNLVLMSVPTSSSNTGLVNLLTINSSTSSSGTITYSISSQSVIGQGNDRNASDEFGTNVLYNSTTKQVIANAPNHGYDLNGQNYISNAGAVYVWNVNSDNTLTFSQKIVSSLRASNNNYGSFMSTGGNLLCICRTIMNAGNAGTAGYFDVYTNSNGMWNYSSSIAMSYVGWTLETDGNTILWDEFNNPGAGSFRVISNYNTNPSNILVLDATSYRETGLRFYSTVNNGTIVISFPYNSTDQTGQNAISNAGNAVVYKLQSDGTWKFYAKLAGWGQDRNINDYFGHAVYTAGNYLYISAPGHGYDINGQNYIANAGLVYVFMKQSNGTYNFIQKIQSNNRSAGYTYFGYDIKSSPDGSTLIITTKTTSSTYEGWAEVYTIKNNNYTFSQYLGNITGKTTGSIIHYNTSDNLIFISRPNYSTITVFSYNSSTLQWSQEQILKLSSLSSVITDTSFPIGMGYSMDYINGLLVAGVPMDSYDSDWEPTDIKTSAGSAILWKRSYNGTSYIWNFVQKIAGSYSNKVKNSQDNFGFGIEILNDNVIVSIPNENYDLNGQNYILDSGMVKILKINSDGSTSDIQSISEPTRTASGRFGDFIKLYNNTLYIFSSGTKNLYEYSFNGATFVYQNTINLSNINTGVLTTTFGYKYKNIINVGDGIITYANTSNIITAIVKENGSWSTAFTSNLPQNSTDHPDITFGSSTGFYHSYDPLSGYLITILNSTTIYVFKLTATEFNYLYYFSPLTVSGISGSTGFSDTGNQKIINTYANGSYIFYTLNIGQGYVLVYELNDNNTGYTFIKLLSPSDITSSTNTYIPTSTKFGSTITMDGNNIAIGWPNACYYKQSNNKVFYTNAGAVALYELNGTAEVSNIHRTVYSSDTLYTVPSGIGGKLRLYIWGDGSTTSSGTLINNGNFGSLDIDVVSGDTIELLIGTKGKNSDSSYSGVVQPNGSISGAATIVKKNGNIISIIGGASASSYGSMIGGSKVSNSYPTTSIVTAGGAGYQYGQSSNSTNLTTGPGTNYFSSDVRVINDYYNISTSYACPELHDSYKLSSFGNVILEYSQIDTVPNITFVSDITPQNTNDYNTSDLFGSALDIKNDLMVVTSPNNSYDANGNNTANLINTGAAWIFQNNETEWGQVQKIVPSGTNARVSNDQFGTNCKIFNGMVAVSCAQHDYNANGQNPYSLTNTGAVWVWTNQNGTWAQIDKLVPQGSEDILSNFGSTIDVYGNIMAIGSYDSCFDNTIIGEENYMIGEENYILSSGSVYIVSFDSNNNFTFESKIVSPNRYTYGNFGYTLKFNQSNGKLYIGEPGYLVPGNTTYPVSAGKIYEYTMGSDSTSWNNSNTITPDSSIPSTNFNFTTNSFGSTIDIGNNKLISSSLNSNIATTGTFFTSSNGYIEYTNPTIYLSKGILPYSSSYYFIISFYISISGTNITRIFTETTSGAYINLDLTSDIINIIYFNGSEVYNYNTGLSNIPGNYSIKLNYNYTLSLNTFSVEVIPPTSDITTNIGWIIGPNSVTESYDNIIYINLSSVPALQGSCYVNLTTSIVPNLNTSDGDPGFYSFKSGKNYIIYNSSTSMVGSSTIYDISSTSIAKIQNFLPTDYNSWFNGNNFGSSVSIDNTSGDIVIGYPGDNVCTGSGISSDTQTSIGSAYVYTYNSTNNNYTLAKRIGQYGNDTNYPLSVQNKTINSSITQTNDITSGNYNGYIEFTDNTGYIEYNGPIYGSSLQYGISIKLYIPSTASTKTRIFTQGTTYIDIDCTGTTPSVNLNFVDQTGVTRTLTATTVKGSWDIIFVIFSTFYNATEFYTYTQQKALYVSNIWVSSNLQSQVFYIGPNSAYSTYDNLIIGGIGEIGGLPTTANQTFTIGTGSVNYYDDYYQGTINKNTAYSTTYPPANVSYIGSNKVENYTTSTFNQVILGQTTGVSAGNGIYYNGIQFTDNTGYVEYAAPAICNYIATSPYHLKMVVHIPSTGGSNTTRIFSQPDVGTYIDITLTSTSGTVSVNFLGKTGTFTISSSYFGTWFQLVFVTYSGSVYCGISPIGIAAISNWLIITAASSSAYVGNIHNTYIGNNSQYSTIDDIIIGGFEISSIYNSPYNASTSYGYLSLRPAGYSVSSLIDYTQGNTTTIYNGYPLYESNKSYQPASMPPSEITPISTSSANVTPGNYSSVSGIPISNTITLTSSFEQNYNIIKMNDNYTVLGYETDSYDYQGNNNITGAGAVHIWKYDSASSTYKFNQRLTSPNRNINGYFGNNILLGENTLIVAASYENYENIQGCGNIYVYSNTGTSPYIWQLTDTIDLSEYNYTNQNIGLSMDFDQTNNLLVIGDPNYIDSTNKHYGRVFYLTKANNIWTVSQIIYNTETNVSQLDNFGASVKINDNNILVGSSNSYNSSEELTSSENSIYVLNNSSGTFKQVQKILPNTTHNNYVGGTNGNIEVSIPNYLASGTGISLEVYISSNLVTIFDLFQFTTGTTNNGPTIFLNSKSGTGVYGYISYGEYISSAWTYISSAASVINFDQWNTISIFNNGGTLQLVVNGIVIATTTSIQTLTTYNFNINTNQYIVLGGISYITSNTQGVPYSSITEAYIDFSNISNIVVAGTTTSQISIVSNNLQVNTENTNNIPQQQISGLILTNISTTNSYTNGYSGTYKISIPNYLATGTGISFKVYVGSYNSTLENIFAGQSYQQSWYFPTLYINDAGATGLVEYYAAYYQTAAATNDLRLPNSIVYNSWNTFTIFNNNGTLTLTVNGNSTTNTKIISETLLTFTISQNIILAGLAYINSATVPSLPYNTASNVVSYIDFANPNSPVIYGDQTKLSITSKTLTTTTPISNLPSITITQKVEYENIINEFTNFDITSNNKLIITTNENTVYSQGSDYTFSELYSSSYLENNDTIISSFIDRNNNTIWTSYNGTNNDNGSSYTNGYSGTYDITIPNYLATGTGISIVFYNETMTTDYSSMTSQKWLSNPGVQFILNNEGSGSFNYRQYNGSWNNFNISGLKIGWNVVSLYNVSGTLHLNLNGTVATSSKIVSNTTNIAIYTNSDSYNDVVNGGFIAGVAYTKAAAVNYPFNQDPNVISYIDFANPTSPVIYGDTTQFSITSKTLQTITPVSNVPQISITESSGSFINCSDIGISSFENTYSYETTNNILSVYDNYAITGTSTSQQVYERNTSEGIIYSPNIFYNGTNPASNIIPTTLSYSNYLLEDQLDIIYSNFYRGHSWGSQYGSSTVVQTSTSFAQNIGKNVKINNGKIIAYVESDTYDEQGNIKGYFGSSTNYNGGWTGCIGSVINLYKGSDGNYRYGKKLFGNISNSQTGTSTSTGITYYYGKPFIDNNDNFYLSAFHSTINTTSNASIGYLTAPTNWLQSSTYTYTDTGIVYNAVQPWAYSSVSKTYTVGDSVFDSSNNSIYFGNWINKGTTGIYYTQNSSSTWSTITSYIPNLINGGNTSNNYFGASMAVIGNNLVVSAYNSTGPTNIGNVISSTQGSGIAYVYDENIKLKTFLGTAQANFGTTGSIIWQYSNAFGQLTENNGILLCRNMNGGYANQAQNTLSILYNLDENGDIEYSGWIIPSADMGPSNGSTTWFNTSIYPITNNIIVNGYGLLTGTGTNIATDRGTATPITYPIIASNGNILDGQSDNGSFSLVNSWIGSFNNGILTFLASGTNYSKILSYNILDTQAELVDILYNPAKTSLYSQPYSNNGYFSIYDNSNNEYYTRVITNDSSGLLSVETTGIDGDVYPSGSISAYCNGQYLVEQIPSYSDLSWELQIAGSGAIILTSKDSSGVYRAINKTNGSVPSLTSSGGCGGGYYGGFSPLYSNVGGFGGSGGYNYAPVNWANYQSTDGSTAPQNTDTDINGAAGGGIYSSASQPGDGAPGHVVITDSSGTKTQFSYIGTDQTYVVPSGISTITIKMWGAGGGSSYTTVSSPSEGKGGAGGYVSGTINVTPSQVYTIMVGEGGISGYTSSLNNPSTTFNYGGGSYGYISSSIMNGAGGGRSQISLGGNIIAVAAGGGGGATKGTVSDNGAPGSVNTIYLPNKSPDLIQLSSGLYGQTRNASDYLGTSVSFIDSNTIIVGAPGHMYNLTGGNLPSGQSGCVWTYKTTNINGQTVWDINDKTIAPVVINNFGSAIYNRNGYLSILANTVNATGVSSGTAIGSSTQTAINLYNYSSEMDYLYNETFQFTDFNVTAGNQIQYNAIDIDTTQDIIIGLKQSPYVGTAVNLSNAGSVNVYSTNNSTWSISAQLVEPGSSNGRVANDLFGTSCLIYNNYIFATLSGRELVYVFKDTGNGYSYYSTITPNTSTTGSIKYFGSTINYNNGVISMGARDSATEKNYYLFNWTYGNNNFVQGIPLSLSGLYYINSYNWANSPCIIDNTGTYIYGNPYDNRGTNGQPSITYAGSITIGNGTNYNTYTIPGRSNGTPSSNNYFGKSVKFLSSSLFAVGAPGHSYDYNGNTLTNTGAIYTYTLNNGIINQDYIISNPYPATTYSGFGSYIKRSSDTSFITGTSSNIVNVLQRIGTSNWKSINSFYVPVNSANSDVYYNGTNLYVTNPTNTYIASTNTDLPYALTTAQGGVVQFVNNNNVWSQEETYVLDGHPSSFVSGFGTTIVATDKSLVISNPNCNIDVNGNSLTSTGGIYTYIFNKYGGLATYKTLLTNTTNNLYGSQLDISKDGTIIIVSGKPDASTTVDIISNTSTPSVIQTITPNSGVSPSSIAINEKNIIAIGCETYDNNTGIVDLYEIDGTSNNWNYNTSLQAFINPTPYDPLNPKNFTTSPLVKTGDYVGGHIYMNSNVGLVYSSIGNSTDQQGNITSIDGAVFVVDVSKHIISD